jgi:hygromycin-B 4-O-kinase
VSAPPSVTAAHVAAFLSDRFGPAVSHVARVGRLGEWSRAFSFRWTGGDAIIRFSAYDEDFCKDQRAAGYASPDLPIPPVLEIGTAFGGFYAISERAFGGFLDSLSEPELRRMLPSLFAALDAARGTDLSATTGYGLWGSDGNAPHQSWRAVLLDAADDRSAVRTHGWRERLTASPTGIGPFAEAFRRLESLVQFCPEERRLAHSDLLNFNVLVSGDRIRAVIDWGSSIYGDFLYDIAWFAFWSPWYPAWRGIDFAAEAARHYARIGLDVPHFAERLRCCQIHIGLGGQAYNAFRGRWPELDAVARRTLLI